MKSILFIVFLGFSSFFCACLCAQEMPTRVITQVVVESNRRFFSDDLAVHSYDLKSNRFIPSKNIGNILSQYTPVIIRNYGSSGSVSTISMHGTGSNHTQVSWNGIPLNSPTTGQADLSLIPAGFIHSVDLINGASGSLFGSGTFGGSVNLINEPDWNNKLSANYSFFAGRYHSLAHLVKLTIGNKLVQYQLSVVSSGSRNNFTYRDTYRYGTPRLENKHNAYREMGIMQNLFVTVDKNKTIEAGLWYQFKQYEIPSLMGSYKLSNASQKDSLFRSFLAFKQSGEKYKWILKSAWLSDFLNYTDKTNSTDSVYSIDSRISASRLIAESDFRFYILPNMIAGTGISFNRLWGNSNNYSANIAENEIAIHATIKMVLKNLILNAGIRKEFYKQLNPQPQYSFGVRYNLNNHFVIRSSVSNKFRKPSFNEKYWQPGGNPQLRPEKGRGGDLTLEWNGTEKPDHTLGFNANISMYYQTVDNWIQWVMEDYLKPVEYKKVHAKGLESHLGINWHSGKWLVKSRFNYNFNRSEIVATYNDNTDTKGNQLAYIPLHTAKIFTDAAYRNLNFGMSTQYTGSRETDESNNPQYRLPAFTLVNISLSWQKQFKQTSISVGVNIDNVFNQAYEVMRSFPVPGRTWLISLSVGFNKKEGNH